MSRTQVKVSVCNSELNEVEMLRFGLSEVFLQPSRQRMRGRLGQGKQCDERSVCDMERPVGKG